MKILFLGVPLEQIDQLCKEEEIVKVSISTYKREITGHVGGEGDTLEEVQTGGWGIQIRSSKDMIQFVSDDARDDEYGEPKEKIEYSDNVKEKFR
jgi:hypothetical protein